MHYLVTGGCGFIGSHLVRALLAAGHQVTVLDDLSTGTREALPDGAVLVVGDILDQPLVTELLEDDLDGCFHLAAIPSVERCLNEWPRTSEVNVSGTIAIFEAARHIEPTIPIVYASSAAVYQSNDSQALTETMPTAPISSYGVDKWACEQYAHMAWRIYGLQTVGMRFFNVYGPGQPLDSPYSGVITKFIHALQSGGQPTIFGDGEQTRDFIYVGDVANALMAAMDLRQKTSEIYNVCRGRSVSVNQLADTLATVMGVSLDAQYKPALSGDIRYSQGDGSKLATVTQLPALTSLAEGLQQTVDVINS